MQYAANIDNIDIIIKVQNEFTVTMFSLLQVAHTHKVIQKGVYSIVIVLCIVAYVQQYRFSVSVI